MSANLPKNLLTSGAFLGTVAVKGLTTAAIFSAANLYMNKLNPKDPAFYRGPIDSFGSSVIAEMLMASIIQRLVASVVPNEGIKKIFDQGLNAAVSSGLNSIVYKYLVSNASIVDRVFENKEEFVIQALADWGAEVLNSNYVIPMLGLN